MVVQDGEICYDEFLQFAYEDVRGTEHLQMSECTITATGLRRETHRLVACGPLLTLLRLSLNMSAGGILTTIRGHLQQSGAAGDTFNALKVRVTAVATE